MHQYAGRAGWAPRACHSQSGPFLALWRPSGWKQNTWRRVLFINTGWVTFWGEVTDLATSCDPVALDTMTANFLKNGSVEYCVPSLHSVLQDAVYRLIFSIQNNCKRNPVIPNVLKTRGITLPKVTKLLSEWWNQDYKTWSTLGLAFLLSSW